jgi:hypothetical protein
MARDDMIPLNTRTKEEQLSIQSMGGIASGKKRKEARQIKDIMIALGEQTVDPSNSLYQKHCENIGQKPKKAGLKVDETLVVSLMNQAKLGNTKAFELWRDQLGQRPLEPEPAVNSALMVLAESLASIFDSETKKTLEEDEEQGGHADQIPS